MKLIEIFCSIQGESTYSGLPCIFIRLAGCNLRCRYCDTKYSYESKFEISVDEIISEIKKYDPVKLVEITGGEPLLQEKVYNLFEKLENEGFFILLETNGSISLQNVPEKIVKIVDVKTAGSESSDSFLLENLNFIDADKDEIKFVLCNKADYEWSKDFIFQNNLENYKLLFSAVTDNLEVKDLAGWIIEDKLPVRLQLQLHKFIWDKNEKGV
ncbi:MAG: 7-carboxy-7-deazaguanine synthase QueE [Candidatus Cloacimonadota bacterium]|nr:MAG: 7-carboxy-7-deazaguanine synthase QueE [Candidatus Cloacimonadota bacterium]